MAAVRGSGTRLENELCEALRAANFGRFQRNVKSLPGRPDVVFRAARVAVFLDSCFWHACRRHLRRPASNLAYWEAKIRRNRARDLAVNRLLRSQGWKILRLWEHQLKRPTSRKRALLALRKLLQE